jgi:hypothetical protein
LWRICKGMLALREANQGEVYDYYKLSMHGKLISSFLTT